ncbi:MAG: hypothetical protein J0L58_04855 [Burkholderiales bacterium]|nr:hypothetical protein [Burkholderiales bacterium]
MSVPPVQTSPPADKGAALMPDGTVAIAQAVLPVWGRQLDVIHTQLNQGISELTQALVRIHELSEGLALLAREPSDVGAGSLASLSPELQVQVDHALSGLQIGDRLSQMLTVVRSDMQRLIDRMPLLGNDGLHHAEEWLEELRSRYTTPEQHEVHGTKAGPADARGIDFF